MEDDVGVVLVWVVFKVGLSLYFLPQISSAEIFVIGAIAKAIAATSTYPLQTVQTILRVKTNLNDMVYCCKSLLQIKALRSA